MVKPLCERMPQPAPEPGSEMIKLSAYALSVRRGCLRMNDHFAPDSDIGGEACSFTNVVPDGKETASARAGKLRPFHKVPRERDIDTILMWVIEPSIPIKMCFRRTPQFVVMRHRAGIPSWTCWTPKMRPQLGGG
jgi:hypothetical protein